MLKGCSTRCRIFIDGIIVLNFLVEEGICTEDAECNLRGDIEILILFEKLFIITSARITFSCLIQVHRKSKKVTVIQETNI